MNAQNTNGNGEFKGYAKASIEFLERRFDDFQAQINRRFNETDQQINELKTNHIAHLQSRLDKIESSLGWNRLWLIGLLGTALVTLAIEVIRGS